MKHLLVFSLSLLSFTLAAQYQLIWSDEFNASSLDLNKWTPEIGQGNWGWGNNELQYYTATANNIVLDTGYLHIIALQQQIGTANYSSARIKTEGKFDFQYGKVEARIKVPMGQGLWPAFWMLGSNISTVSWPLCGEIDVMEHINNEMLIHGTHHYDNNGHVYQGDTIGTNPADFHIYSIEWTSDSIQWFLDGQLYFQTNIGAGSVSKTEFHAPFFLLLNMAVGGNWPGSPNTATAFPATMMIDYVRVYQDTVPTPDLNISVDLCNQTPNTVRMVGPQWNNWDPNAGPIASDNGDGSWTFNFNPAPANPMEYLIAVDGVYENLIEDMQNAGGCAPITDYWSYANRLWNPSDGLSIDINYDRCVPCSYPDLSVKVNFCDTTGLNTAKLVSSIHGWNYANAKNGFNNGDGSWTFQFSPVPMDSFEFVIYRDGVAENLIDDMQQGANCAPITNYSSYANRLWTLQDSSLKEITFDSCNSCSTPPALFINNLNGQSPTCFNDNNGSISVSAAGGNPPYSYQWNNAAMDTSASVQNLVAGTYSVSIIDANGTLLIDSIVLNNPPQFSATINSTDTSACGNCSGQLDVLNTNGNPPFQYQWNTLNNSTSLATGLCPGLYQVSVVDADGCLSMATSLITNGGLVVDSIQCSDPNLILCDGQSLTLSTSGNYASYLWSNNQTGATISINTGNNYSVTITDSLGCSIVETITISNLSSPNDSSFQVNTNDYLANFTSNPGFDYQWFFGDGDSASVQNPSHLYDSLGQFEVLLILTNACGIDSIVQWVQISMPLSSTSSKHYLKLKVYPNPFGDKCSFVYHNPQQRLCLLNLYDSKGSLVRNYRSNNSSTIEISRKGLLNGLYWYQFIGPNFETSGKLLIE